MVDQESRLSELRCRIVSRPAPLRSSVYIPATLLRLQLTDFDLGSSPFPYPRLLQVVHLPNLEEDDLGWGVPLDVMRHLRWIEMHAGSHLLSCFVSYTHHELLSLVITLPRKQARAKPLAFERAGLLLAFIRIQRYSEASA
jgi:hypothetical protein